MAFSRRLRRKGAVLAAVALAGALALGGVPAAFAESFVEEVPDGALSIVGVRTEALGEAREAAAGEELRLGRFCAREMTVDTDPATAELGVSCGMDWMCGLDPCLCGSSDRWGSCSCNGLEERAPEVACTSSDESVLRVEAESGRIRLVPVGDGEAVLSLEASMSHHTPTSAEVQVRVGGMEAAEWAWTALAAAAIAVAGACAALITRQVRKRAAEAPAAADGKGDDDE